MLSPSTRVGKLALAVVVFLAVLAVASLVYYVIGLGTGGGSGTDEYPPLP